MHKLDCIQHILLHKNTLQFFQGVASAPFHACGIVRIVFVQILL